MKNAIGKQINSYVIIAQVPKDNAGRHTWLWTIVGHDPDNEDVPYCVWTWNERAESHVSGFEEGRIMGASGGRYRSNYEAALKEFTR